MTARPLCVVAAAFALSASTSPSAAAQSWLKRLMRFAGLTASPGQMKAPEEIDAGDVWVADVELHTVTQLSRNGGYRWPVFHPVSSVVLVLKDRSLVRIEPDGTATRLRELRNVAKLVGFDRDDPDLLLVVDDIGSSGSPLVVLSLQSGVMRALPYDSKSGAQRRMLEHIRGQKRVYGDATVYVNEEQKAGLARTQEWTEVYLRRGDAPPENVSRCDGVNCQQPSLSRDGRRMAFIKVGSGPR